MLYLHLGTRKVQNHQSLSLNWMKKALIGFVNYYFYAVIATATETMLVSFQFFKQNGPPRIQPCPSSHRFSIVLMDKFLLALSIDYYLPYKFVLSISALAPTIPQERKAQKLFALREIKSFLYQLVA